MDLASKDASFKTVCSIGAWWKNPPGTCGTPCFLPPIRCTKPQVMEKSTRHLWNKLF